MTTFLDELEKALQHRYIRRIPQAGGGYRYIYPDKAGDRHKAGTKVRLEAVEAKGSGGVVKGESFSAGPGKGHYTITAVGDGKISYILDDDGTGKSHEVRGIEMFRFRSLVVDAHKDALRAKAADGMARLQGVVKAATQHGTPKQQERAKALLSAFQVKYKGHLKIDDVTFAPESERSAPTPKDVALSPLEGTTKQVAWATDIRSKANPLREGQAAALAILSIAKEDTLAAHDAGKASKLYPNLPRRNDGQFEEDSKEKLAILASSFDDKQALVPALAEALASLSSSKDWIEMRGLGERGNPAGTIPRLARASEKYDATGEGMAIWASSFFEGEESSIVTLLETFARHSPPLSDDLKKRRQEAKDRLVEWGKATLRADLDRRFSSIEKSPTLSGSVVRSRLPAMGMISLGEASFKEGTEITLESLQELHSVCRAAHMAFFPHAAVSEVGLSLLEKRLPKPSSSRDLLPGEVGKAPVAALGSLRASYGKEFFSELEQKAVKPGSNLNFSSVQTLGDWVSSVTPERFDKAANEVYRTRGDRFSATELAAFESVRKGEFSSDAMERALKDLGDGEKSDEEMFAHLVGASHLAAVAKNAPAKKKPASPASESK